MYERILSMRDNTVNADVTHEFSARAVARSKTQSLQLGCCTIKRASNNTLNVGCASHIFRLDLKHTHRCCACRHKGAGSSRVKGRTARAGCLETCRHGLLRASYDAMPQSTLQCAVAAIQKRSKPRRQQLMTDLPD